MNYDKWKEFRNNLDNLNNMERCAASMFITELLKEIMDHIQPERSKREDFYLEDLINEYMEEMNNNSVYDFLDWYKKRCGALNIMETQ